MLIEKIKADAAQLRQWLQLSSYGIIEAGINLLAIHAADSSLAEIAPQAQLHEPTPA